MSYDPHQQAHPVNYVPGTYTPSPAYVPPTIYGHQLSPPEPPRRRIWPLVAAATVFGVVAQALAAVLAWPHLRPEPEPATPKWITEATAQRECRTAFQKEWQKRVDTVKDDDTLATVTSIDVEETWQVQGGWSVNGTVHYTVTAALIAPVPDSVDLTCTATGRDGSPLISVANRG